MLQAGQWVRVKYTRWPIYIPEKRFVTCVPFQYISIRFRISPSFPGDMGCQSSTLYFCYSRKKEIKPECMLVLA